jgi:predicted RND superfamily exporter protein
MLQKIAEIREGFDPNSMGGLFYASRTLDRLESLIANQKTNEQIKPTRPGLKQQSPTIMQEIVKLRQDLESNVGTRFVLDAINELESLVARNNEKNGGDKEGGSK